MNPAVGKLRLPFTDVVGEFDSLIDTLEDEVNLFRVPKFTAENNAVTNQFVLNTLRNKYKCKRYVTCPTYVLTNSITLYPSWKKMLTNPVSHILICNCDKTRYISTITHSQRYVLSKGLLFARDSVLKYQNDVENHLESDYFQQIRPPMNYGNETLQSIFDAGIVYKADRNENGPHANKPTFVRGWTLSDLAELKTWPRVTPKVRFGFPVADQINQKMKKTTVKETESSSNVKTSKNPFVTAIDDVKTLNDIVVSTNTNAILFLSASYCRTCKTIFPMYQRMARIFKEEKKADLVFGIVDIASKDGKQLGNLLEVESVPSFLLFSGGEQFGDRMKVKKLPSRELDSMIEKLLQESK